MALLGRPVVITDAMLSSSTVPETVPAVWSAGTTYGNTATAAVSAGGTAWDVYVSIQASNTNNAPASSPTWWRKVTTLYSAVSSTIPYFKDQIVTDTVNHRLYKSLVGTANSVTANGTTDVITWVGNTLANGNPVVFNESFGPTAGTTYYVGDKSGDTFRLYTAVSGGSLVDITGSSTTTRTIVTSANLNAPFTDEAKWADAGPTNRRAMFDKSNATVTSEDNQQMVVVITMPTGTRFNALALLNLTGVSSVTIHAMTPNLVVRYNQTFSLADSSFADESYAGTYTETIYRRSMAVSDIPPFDAMTLTITLSGPGVVSIGNAVPALTNWIGDAERDARTGTRDYSIKDETEWGGINLTQRGYANIGTFKSYIPTRKSDAIKDLLDRCRATPMLWLMAEDKAMPGGWAGRGIYYGIWKNFSMGWTDGDEDELDTELLGFV